ncbi:YwaF family protein [Paenibacillus arenilitoris]|uniref:TIGR02206 family membrane protein n=1 Tax=Paenibacillus arenilitoris TaxID=2772299 RepID=A0A927CR82_9BACL|nr:TIGR02206 family membrane protein [Paenibacillus arenilitoris]MBD2870160.1 TIGR02206 family membrane protein [Paenibacillus arenilitoris]
MDFEPFSAAHYSALGAAGIFFAIIIACRKYLRRPKPNRIARASLAVVLLASEASLQLSYVLAGSWGVESLPFQLCSLMVLLSAVVMLANRKRLYGLVFFLGTLGALQALLTPSLNEGFPHFRYFHFFAAHIAIIGAAVFLLAVERYRPTIRSVIGALLGLHALAVPAAIANALTGTTNFMFLARKPDTASLLDLLAPWPWYLLQLELVAFAMCMLLWGAVRLASHTYGK